MTRKVSEERHGLRLTGGKTYAARLSIPRERWADVGRAYGTRTGVRQELVRSTQTRDRHEAIRRRGKVLERLRAEVDAKLAAIGLPPLHGTWCPDWMTEERLVADALETRTRITDASDEPEGYEEDGRTQESPRDHIRMGLEAFLDDRAEELERAGQDGQSYRARYREIALGEVTPIGRLFERWKRDIGTTIKAQTLRGHDLSFRLLGEFLLPDPKERTSSPDPAALIASLNVEHITRRVAGGFPEWLAQDRGLSAKTIQSRISPLKTFWDWLERKG